MELKNGESRKTSFLVLRGSIAVYIYIYIYIIYIYNIYMFVYIYIYIYIIFIHWWSLKEAEKQQQ